MCLKAAKLAAGGYIFLDVLIGILLFGLGITVMMSLTNTAVLAEEEAVNYLAAVNLAGSSLDQTMSTLQTDLDTRNVLPGQAVTDQVGRYERLTQVDWDSEELLKISIRIQWLEKGENRNYSLEGLCWVKEQ